MGENVYYWAIIYTNTGLLLVGSLGANASETGIQIQQLSYKKIILNQFIDGWAMGCP